MERKEILEAIQRELSASLLCDGYVARIGNMFFRFNDSGCVQRDLVYTIRKKYDFAFDLLSLDWGYYTGSKEHALALQQALGGEVYPSEYVKSENPEDIWIWERPGYNQQIAHEPLEIPKMKEILFDKA